MLHTICAVRRFTGRRLYFPSSDHLSHASWQARHLYGRLPRYPIIHGTLYRWHARQPRNQPRQHQWASSLRSCPGTSRCYHDQRMSCVPLTWRYPERLAALGQSRAKGYTNFLPMTCGAPFLICIVARKLIHRDNPPPPTSTVTTLSIAICYATADSARPIIDLHPVRIVTSTSTHTLYTHAHLRLLPHLIVDAHLQRKSMSATDPRSQRVPTTQAEP